MSDRQQIERFKSAYRRGVMTFFDREEQLLILAGLERWQSLHKRYRALCGWAHLASLVCVAGILSALLGHGGPWLAATSASAYFVLEFWTLPWLRAKKHGVEEGGKAFMRHVAEKMIERVEFHRVNLDRDIRAMLEAVETDIQRNGQRREPQG